MDKEAKWLKQRCGKITASELCNIVSASGKIIDINLNYIRKKKWERKRGFSHPVSTRQMEIGNEQEPFVIDWCRKNLGLELIYSKELAEIPFWLAPDCPLGASPDAYTPDKRIVIEAKTLVGAKEIEFFGDEDTSYEEKKLAVWNDHGPQLLGQFLANPRVEEIWLVKYIYQDDNIMEDSDSPLAPWRGVVFRFRREDYAESIEEMRKRVLLFDAFIDSDINPSKMKEGWELVDGRLVKIKKEK
nr:MAG TPA: Exonuclease [Bacteriophage sp.]